MPFSNTDRVRMGMMSVSYGAGSGAGAAVAVNVAANIPPGALIIPAGVSGAYSDVSAVTTAGFTLTITPRAGGSTLAAGSAGVFVIA